MSAIKEAMGNLFEALDTLEKAAGRAEMKAARKAKTPNQVDLFGGREAYAVDPALVARKLDKTIAGIEKMLAEG